MLELGQPLHAFDYSKVKGDISVRRAKAQEKLLLLDGKERDLNPEVLVIADSEKALAVAGIMGGEGTSVTESTQDILLESACFNPSRVRRGCKVLAISTDSSKRFERGIDALQVLRALDRAAMLLEEICGVKPLKGVVRAGDFTANPVKIDCRLTRISDILGLHVSLNEVETIFKRLEFKYKWDGKNTFTIEAPSYRNDLKLEIDIIEEVARVIGYENIPKKIPYFTASSCNHAPLFLFEREVRERLVAEEMQEFINCDLISPQEVNMIVSKDIDPASFISVLNPTSIDQSILRPSLIPGLLGVVKRNFDYQNHNIRGFEIGKIHFKDQHFQEQSMASMVFTGLAMPHSWDSTDRSVDFFDLKGVIENLFKALRVENVTFEKSNLAFFHPGRQAKIMCQGLELGILGEVHPELQIKLDIPERIYCAELNLQDLLAVRSKPKKMEAMPLYPSSSRDWTVTVKEEVPVSQILTAIRSIDSPYLESFKLKYIYRSEKLGEKKKNVTIHFIYRDLNETIENRTVDLEHARVVEMATSSIKMS
jgi:phenylalanyl-tRNA synthetase beta chain